jgi:hypothetical protein
MHGSILHWISSSLATCCRTLTLPLTNVSFCQTLSNQLSSDMSVLSINRNCLSRNRYLYTSKIRHLWQRIYFRMKVSSISLFHRSKRRIIHLFVVNWHRHRSDCKHLVYLHLHLRLLVLVANTRLCKYDWEQQEKIDLETEYRGYYSCLRSIGQMPNCSWRQSLRLRRHQDRDHTMTNTKVSNWWEVLWSFRRHHWQSIECLVYWRQQQIHCPYNRCEQVQSGFQRWEWASCSLPYNCMNIESTKLELINWLTPMFRVPMPNTQAL